MNEGAPATQSGGAGPSDGGVDVVIVVIDTGREVWDLMAALPPQANVVIARIGSKDRSDESSEGSGPKVLELGAGVAFATAANAGAALGKAPRVLFVTPGARPSRAAISTMFESLSGPRAGLVLAVRPAQEVVCHNTATSSKLLRTLAHWVKGLSTQDEGSLTSPAAILADRDAFQVAGWFDEGLSLPQCVTALRHRITDLGRHVAVQPMTGGMSNATRRKAMVKRILRRATQRCRTVLVPCRGHGLVVCSLERWDAGDAWRGNNRYVQALVEADPRLRVLFIEPVHMPLALLRMKLKMGAEYQHHARERGLRPTEEHQRIVCYQPVQLLPRRTGRLADAIRDLQVQFAAWRAGLARPTLLINDPIYTTLKARAPWHTVADVTDDWGDLGPLTDPVRRARELTLLDSDVPVMVPTRTLSQTSLWAPRDLIETTDVSWRAEHLLEPPRAYPTRRTVVFAGEISSKTLDIELFISVAEQCPDVAWLAIGPGPHERIAAQRLQASGIMTLVSTSQIMTARYMAAADLVVLPLIPGVHSERTSVLVAEELRALGVPAVSVPMRAFIEVGPPIEIADHGEFLEVVRNSLSNTSPVMRDRPQASDRKAAVIRSVISSSQSGND